MKFKYLVLAASLSAVVSTGANAKDPFEKEIKARKSQMQILAFNMGILGGMARGKRDYDADLATLAATNLSQAAAMSTGHMWPKDSGNDKAKNTDALPSIWDQLEQVGKYNSSLKDASVKLAAEAGNGLGALRKSLGGVGKNCKGCHDDFKAE